jgi:hypothetical protein
LYLDRGFDNNGVVAFLETLSRTRRDVQESPKWNVP